MHGTSEQRRRRGGCRRGSPGGARMQSVTIASILFIYLFILGINGPVLPSSV